MANQDLNPAAGNGTQGSSYMYEFGTSPNTRTAVSQKVRVLAPAYGSEENALLQIGVLASFNVSESRSPEPVRGIGFGDHVHELVPGPTEPATADVSRALLYLANLWQATGYASGVSGPVRSLKHHKWPFDTEQQLVFSTLADRDLTGDDSGQTGVGFQGGVRAVSFNQGVTQGGSPESSPGANVGHTAIITLYEACWWNNWSIAIEKDSGIIMESGGLTITDIHDFSSTYGEFLATGNDPSIGQVGSIRYGLSRGRAFAIQGVSGGTNNSVEVNPGG